MINCKNFMELSLPTVNIKNTSLTSQNYSKIDNFFSSVFAICHKKTNAGDEKKTFPVQDMPLKNKNFNRLLKLPAEKNSSVNQQYNSKSNSNSIFESPFSEKQCNTLSDRTNFSVPSSPVTKTLLSTRKKNLSTFFTKTQKPQKISFSQDIQDKEDNTSEKQEVNNLKDAINWQSSPSSKKNLTFAQRIKLQKGLRTGNIPVKLLSQKLLLEKEQQEKKKFKAARKLKEEMEKKKKTTNKTYSVDAIYDIENTEHLAEALLAIADTQPLVARSTPKHSPSIEIFYGFGATNAAEQVRNQKRLEERYKKNCMFKPVFYEQMLADSLMMCEMLQTHLSDCINGVRAKTPTALSSPFNSPQTSPLLLRSQSIQPLIHNNSNLKSTPKSYNSNCSKNLVPTYCSNTLKNIYHDKDQRNLNKNKKVLKFSNDCINNNFSINSTSFLPPFPTYSRKYSKNK